MFFLNTFFCCLHTFFIFIFLLPPQDEDYGSDEVENLRSLVSNLRQLLDLHQKYSCKLSLSVLEKVSLLLLLLLLLCCSFK